MKTDLTKALDVLISDAHFCSNSDIISRLIEISDMSKDYILPAGFGDTGSHSISEEKRFDPTRPEDVSCKEEIPESVRKFLDADRNQYSSRYVEAVKAARQIIPGYHNLKQSKDAVDMWIAKFYPNFH